MQRALSNDAQINEICKLAPELVETEEKTKHASYVIRVPIHIIDTFRFFSDITLPRLFVHELFYLTPYRLKASHIHTRKAVRRTLEHIGPPTLVTLHP